MREEIIDHTLGQEMDLEIDGQECMYSLFRAGYVCRVLSMAL